MCALLTVCVLTVLPLPRLPGTAHTLGRSLFIQTAGYSRARLWWRQPKRGLLFPFLHFLANMKSQCSMLQWRHLLLARAKQCSWVPTFSSPTCVFYVPGGNFWAFYSGLLSCVLLELFSVHYFPSRKAMFLDKGGDCFISLTGKRLGHF